jgi:hypothetical protein
MCEGGIDVASDTTRRSCADVTDGDTTTGILGDPEIPGTVTCRVSTSPSAPVVASDEDDAAWSDMAG